MIVSMTGQARLFLLTALAGFALGFLYDLFRILRKTVHHPDWMTNVEDVIYWLMVSFAMFYFMLSKTYGEIRFFNIVGTFLGMVGYFFTLSRPVMKVSMAVVDFLKKVIQATIKILLLPLRFFLNILKIPVNFSVSLAKRVGRPGKRVLQKSRRYARIKGKKFKNDLKIMFKKV